MATIDDLGAAFVELALGSCGAPQEFYRAAWLNYLGIARAGCHEPAVEAFVRSRAILSPGSYAPFGHEPCLTLPDVVMANCYASSLQAFDDIHFATTTHPAGPVASAILGAAELVPVSMTAAAEALAVGMEAECRLALALFASGTGAAAGWYTTGVAGGMGAAAAVGRLLGLDETHMASALGWAAATACGVRGTHGSAAGTFVPALAARAGLEAALLARDGLTCGIGALTGPNGLVAQIASHPALDRVMEGIGTTWVSMETSAKPYPFGFVAFAAVDAARELGNVSEAAAIDIYVSSRSAQLGGNPHPTTSDEALVSIPYIVARTLADPASVTRPLPATLELTAREEALLARIKVHVDPALADSAARIEADGGVQVVTCATARGSAKRPLTIEETISKVRSISTLEAPSHTIDAVMHGNASLIGVAMLATGA